MCTGLGEGVEYFTSGGHNFTLVLPPDKVEGVTYKEFDSIEVVMGVVADFGVVSRMYQKQPRPIETLVFARINGSEYGTPGFSFPTASQAQSPSSSSRGVSIYPNPARSVANIQFDVAETDDYSIEVFDVLGRRTTSIDLGTLSPGRFEQRFDLSAFAQGSYLVRLSTQGGTTSTRTFSHIN